MLLRLFKSIEMFKAIEAVGTTSAPLAIFYYTKQLRQKELMICASCWITSFRLVHGFCFTMFFLLTMFYNLLVLYNALFYSIMLHNCG